MTPEDLLRQAAQAAQQLQSAAPPQAQGVQPGPVPMSIQISQAQDNTGQQLVVLVLSHAVGQSVFFFDAEGAERLGEKLKDIARTARTGLTIVNN